MKYGMSELWDAVDNTINHFVKESGTSHALWHEDCKVSMHDGLPTSHVLRGSKTIVGVDSECDANTLTKRLKDMLAQPYFLVNNKKSDSDTPQKRPYPLKIKIINCLTYGQITLTVSAIPVSRHNMTKEQIVKYVKNSFTTLITFESEEKRRVLKELKNDAITRINSALLDDALYVISYYKPTASAYRILYNDASRVRKQTAVGDVLIAIHGSAVVSDTRVTKRRTDAYAARPALFDIDNPFTFSIYQERMT